MEEPANQIENDRVHRFIESVRAFKAGQAQHVLTLSEYWPPEIADAIRYLIDSAVSKEREACAIIAESASEPSGAYRAGASFEPDKIRRGICLEIAGSIRKRR